MILQLDLGEQLIYVKPFNFPDPILNINENCTEANKKYSDKVLSIWDINSIPDFK